MPSAANKRRFQESIDGQSANKKPTIQEESSSDEEDDQIHLIHRNNDSSFKPPTNEEMHRLTQTSELFKSNLFKMQMDELLEEVSVSSGKKRRIDGCLQQMKQILDQMEDREAVSWTQAKQRLGDIVIPVGPNIQEPAEDSQLKFSFQKPANVAVVGSYMLQTTVKHVSMVNADLAVTMPQSLFQEKDYLNYRYLLKRSFYLAAISQQFKRHSFFASYCIQFEFLNNDVRRPALVVSDLKSHFCIRILPTIAASTFSDLRLSPLRCNLRCEATTSTVQYNNCVLLDTCYIVHLNLLHRYSTISPAFKEASILAKVWLSQRNLSIGRGSGFSGFMFVMVMGWLMQSSTTCATASCFRISKAFSSFQMLRMTIGFLAEFPFDSCALFLTPTGEPIDETSFSRSAFESQFDVSIVDPSGRINLAAHLSLSAIAELQLEAQRATRMFKDASDDHFANLFLKNVHQPLLKYDNIIVVPKLPSFPVEYTNSPKMQLDFPDGFEFMLRFIPKLLKNALKDRLNLVTAFAPSIPRWDCCQPYRAAPHDTCLTIGFILHPHNALRIVETGPSGDDVDGIAKFRALWGEKSEMRRFKDGTISESVVFDCDNTIQDRALIVCRMAGHLLARHCGILPDEPVAASYWAGLGGRFIKAPGVKSSSQSFQPVMDALESLRTQLKSLKLPLAISSVTPTCDALRSCSVFVPQPKPHEAQFLDGYRPMVDYLSLVIEFEGSGKWPDDLKAIQTMKRAFYIRIGQLLETEYPGTRVSVSVGTGADLEQSGWLDVTQPSGYTFRCRINHERENYLLQRLVKECSKKSPADLLHAKKSHQTYLTENVYKPWHSSRLSQLCYRMSFLPLTIRILKRWAASHMLVSYATTSSIPEEMLELIAAFVYTHPEPYDVPTSAFTGFMRCLDVIVTWDWRDEPMIVEMEAGKLDASVSNLIKERFDASRKLPRSPCMYIATEGDHEGSWWTANHKGNHPEQIVLDRLVATAKSTIKQMQMQLEAAMKLRGDIEGSPTDMTRVFTTPMGAYPLIIHLDQRKCPRFRQNLSYSSDTAPIVKTKYKNLVSSQDKEHAVLTGFDPIQCYISDLKAAFDDIAYFLHDVYGGDKIAVVWKRKVYDAPTAFKINAPFNIKVTANDQVEINLDAVIAEMARLGNGLVLAIQKQ